MKKSPGFTLIECLIVIIILAAISGYAVARWPGDNISLNAQAQQLAGVIRYTQSLSFFCGQRYRLNLTTSAYNITDLSGNSIADPVTGAISDNFKTGTSVAFTNLTNNLIAFDGQGIPYIDSTAATPLGSSASIKLTRGSVSRTVTITPQTGSVIVS